MTIQPHISYEAYRALPGINVSSLKELRRSPMHYRHALANPKTSAAMALGTAAHVATLEPERYDSAFAVWDRRTESGRAAPRSGKAWDAFVAESGSLQILTADEDAQARAIAAAVRRDPAASRYLAAGWPEVSMSWAGPGGRTLKGRIDWMTEIDGVDVVVGLKTTRDCRHYQFAAHAHRLGYHLQWAYYFDGFAALRGRVPQMVEIVVESEAPHAVVVYTISDDIISLGRDEYTALLSTLAECEASGQWPGPASVEQELTFPTWAYGRADEDISDLGLEE